MTHSLDVLGRLSVEVPTRLVELAEQASGEPVVPTPSASVVLLRDGPVGLETYLLIRHARMAFAAEMAVFPGGRLDPADGSGPDALVRCALRETAEETGVRLGADALRPWAHWITPEPEPRRFDTAFFVAALPADQDAHDISGETETADWWRPRAAVTAHANHALGLMPPTLSILLELADLESVAAVLDAAAGRVIETVRPVVEPTADGWRFRYPQRADA